MEPVFFANQTDFRKWLKKNYFTKTELIVGFYKVNSGKPSMTWSESVDQALCYGWIDGIRRSIDDESYSIRFTPRNPKSNWSDVNIKKVELLIEKGLMHESGLALFNNRRENKSKNYSFENDPKVLSENFEEQFKENKKAWEFFNMQAPSYRRTIIHWINTAKQGTTRLSRLNKTISASESQKRIWN